MQKHVNLVDLVKSFPTNIYLQNLASIQKRTSPVKFAHLAEKSENGSISNLSTKVPGRATIESSFPRRVLRAISQGSKQDSEVVLDPEAAAGPDVASGSEARRPLGLTVKPARRGCLLKRTHY